MNEVFSFLAIVVGFIFLWAAADVHRGPESKICFLDKYWWLQLLLILIGVSIIQAVQ